MHVRYVSILSEPLRRINMMQEDRLCPANDSDGSVFPYLSTANISLSDSTALNQMLTRSRIHFSTYSLTDSLTPVLPVSDVSHFLLANHIGCLRVEDARCKREPLNQHAVGAASQDSGTTAGLPARRQRLQYQTEHFFITELRGLAHPLICNERC